MTLPRALEAMRILQMQLAEKGITHRTEYEEIMITQNAIRLRRDGKTLRVPLVEL